MIARGPTLAADGTLTTSVHVLDLPDVAAARAFALDQPGWQAGAYRDVLVRRWRGSSTGTLWDFVGRLGRDLLSDDGSLVVGAAVLLEADDAGVVRAVLDTDTYVGTEVHRWRPGGRPAS